ncbi:MAG: DNA cytosine methyltransferase [Gammaproteobacteria bacterium]|nr:DNA cytosine methyltransferase [Gammaproteobacteria bacterium]MCY4166321.1 DNA cytosine methyltransferase [Gammaproteobacteria bacterium]MCY4254556.1 DNA cytosine methyltransferase [Gammaproteobacteria bacterium]MCY4340256.1 DNA cytosine methyltransferase [Gammaproteobacteria bacterium]
MAQNTANTGGGSRKIAAGAAIVTKSKRFAVDLFCGCGGISSGLRDAGFRILAGADMERHYIQTYQENFPEAESLRIDLAAVPPKNFGSSLKIRPGELDLLAGGPPCQGFSKNVPRSRRTSDLANNLLIRTFLDYCEYLRPKMILMENVAEMRNGFDQSYTSEIGERLTTLGYSVQHSILNAADYGVPQRRRRAFFLAAADGAPIKFPQPTHSKPGDQISLPGIEKKSNHLSVWEAISDLPSLLHGTGSQPCEYISRPRNTFQRKMRNASGKVMNHVARKLRPRQLERLSSLEPGQGHKNLPVHLRTKSGYSGAYGRLTKEMVAPTITRWVFHPGSGRFGHPVDIRTITMRETARIQGFKDSFVLIGSYTQQAGQLGNAVPPLLIEKICNGLPS